jgi:hypothetical protein
VRDDLASVVRSGGHGKDITPLQPSQFQTSRGFRRGQLSEGTDFYVCPTARPLTGCRRSRFAPRYVGPEDIFMKRPRPSGLRYCSFPIPAHARKRRRSSVAPGSARRKVRIRGHLETFALADYRTRVRIEYESRRAVSASDRKNARSKLKIRRSPLPGLQPAVHG